MTRIVTTAAAALARIKVKCAIDQTPVLDPALGYDSDENPTEIQSILDDNERASVWAAETKYKVGDLIIPTEDNRVGRLLKCVATGTSGTEEPDWLPVADRASALNGGVVIGNIGSAAVIVSDGTVAWVDAGEETDLWYMDQVFSDVWMLKGSKVADMQNVSSGGNTYEFNNIYRNCMDQAARYGGKFIL